MVQGVTMNVPDCAACGCGDVAVIKWPDETEWFPSGRAQCNHCSAVFTFPNEENEPKPKTNGVRYVRVRCPKCQKRGAPVTHTEKLKRGDGTIWGVRRQHKCKCGHCFKSLEDL